MEKNRLRDMISDLEIANRNLYVLQSKIPDKEKEIFEETYQLIKKSIQGLNEEEVRMEVYQHSDECLEEEQ